MQRGRCPHESALKQQPFPAALQGAWRLQQRRVGMRRCISRTSIHAQKCAMSSRGIRYCFDAALRQRRRSSLAIGQTMLTDHMERTSTMCAYSVPTFVFLASLAAAAEVRVPTLAVAKSCKSMSSLAAGGLSSDKCLEQENAAKAELEKSWSTFSAPDRDKCISLAHGGGYPSYIELLGCVQMARDARALEQKYKTDT